MYAIRSYYGYISAAAAAVLVLVFGLSFYNQPLSSGNYAAASGAMATERVKGLKPTMKIYRSKGDSAEIP